LITHRIVGVASGSAQRVRNEQNPV
jgi:hypothetical protein